LVPVQVGEYLQKILPDARLVIFEKSGHCPFLEEPDLFNTVVDQFIQSLGRFPSPMQEDEDGV
jgi:non-heme chloroperoxidase